jgi:hypothetical protein
MDTHRALLTWIGVLASVAVLLGGSGCELIGGLEGIHYESDDGGRDSGAACTAGDQCASSLCTNGVCCDAACDGGCGACSSAAKPSCAPVAGLIAYYPLDVDTLDHSGNGNDATGFDLTAIPGKVGGGARAFNGNDSCLSVSGSAKLTGSRTFCAWLNPSPRAGLGQPVFSAGQPMFLTGDFFSISASSPDGGTCGFVPANVPFIDHTGAPCYEASAISLAADAWHFVCYAHDEAGTVTFYGDGRAVAAVGTEYDYPIASVHLGCLGLLYSTTTQPVLLGDLDEVTIWTDALDAGDVAALWNGGAGCAAR